MVNHLNEAIGKINQSYTGYYSNTSNILWV